MQINHNSAPQERYQYKPFLGSSHSWALKIINDLKLFEPALDVGPGSGALGLALKNKGAKALFAVEPDPRAREHVSTIYSKVEERLEALGDQKYNLVLLLDVLEHMEKPSEFLNQLQNHLNPGATIMVSVPNIAHWSIRFSLLFGRFDYTERGILDKTHLQHFTRKRILKLLNEIDGFKVKETSGSIEPAEFVLPKFIWDNKIFRKFSEFRIKLAEIFPGIFAYQHLILLNYKT